MAATRSDEEQWLRAYRRIRAVRNRPSTQAAQEFLGETDWRSLPRRLHRLGNVLETWNADIDSEELSCSLSQDPRESRRLAMTAAVMANVPPSFLAGFHSLFRASLAARQSLWEGNSLNYDKQEEEQLFHSLRTLGWIRRDGRLAQPLGEALHHTIYTQVRNTIQANFEEDTLFQSVQSWKDAVVDTWVHDLVGPAAYETDDWSAKLTFCTAECFCQVRMEEMFDMVTDYPDSHPAVLELRDVLQRTNMHPQEALHASLTKRLIHPGANTSQIIDVYINMIKVLREIDPSHRLLDVVAEPVRSYLRGRSDTVRCIITSLTDEEAGGDLYEELRRQDARPLEQAQLDSDDEEEPPTMDWMPPPPLTKSSMSNGSKGNSGDILSMLVSIYGSKELFVNEYRLMLADKLLANVDFDTDREVHTLELLKLRFGEMSMRQCEIMIKDMDDSKRIISNIHSTIKSKNREPLVDAAIVSHIFWPSLQKEQLKHHPRIQTELDQFSEEYGKLKNPRRLAWLNQLGIVQLELDVVEEGIDGLPQIETKQFNCSPLLATLILHFEDKDQWTSDDLSNELGIAEHVVQKRLGFWINNRVLQLSVTEEGETAYVLASREKWLETEQGPDSAAAFMMQEDGMDGQAVSLGVQGEEEIELFESYIMGMLQNLGQLPLDRIHNMLNVVATSGSDHKYDMTPNQLSMFLQQLCKREKIECGPDGLYKVFKK